MKLNYQKIFGITSAVLSGIVSVTSIITNITHSNYFKSHPLHLDAVMEILNIGILLVFAFALKPREHVLENNAERIALARLLNIEDAQYHKLDYNNDRVNMLILQLMRSLKWFIIILIFFFIFNLYQDLWLKGSTNTVLIKFTNYFETLTNTLSAAFLYLCFSVLYDTTLDNENKTNQKYYKGTLSFVITFFLVYTGLLFVKGDYNIAEIFKFISGFYNGLAMVLLFGRITAMDYFFKDNNLETDRISRNLYIWGIYLILPLYALVQPMYPVLELKLFNAENLVTTKEIFKAFVFLVCFVGKGFFLLLIFTFVNQKWLHIYIHLVLANEDIPKKMIAVEKAKQEEKPPLLPMDIAEPVEMESADLIELAGEYEYTCSQSDGSHSHGGDCIITPITNYRNVIEWKIKGVRRWSTNAKGQKEILAVPFPWTSDTAIIFKQLTYLYNFNIAVDMNIMSGVSHGHIVLSGDQIVEFIGNYFQRSAGGSVWGTEVIRRKPRPASFPAHDFQTVQPPSPPNQRRPELY